MSENQRKALSAGIAALFFLFGWAIIVALKVNNAPSSQASVYAIEQRENALPEERNAIDLAED